MKKYTLLTPALLLALSVTSNSASSAVLSFDFTPATPVLISELGGVYNGAVTYTSGLGVINSATLSLKLSDNGSDTFGLGVIDAPKEFATLSGLSDGAVNQAGSTKVEVEPNPFTTAQINPATGLPFTAAQVAAANTLGLEFSNIPSNVQASYFNLDVTNLVGTGDSGTLNFSLSDIGQFPDITPSNPFYPQIAAFISLIGGKVPTGTLPIIEDYNFHSAQLTIDYQPKDGRSVPTPPILWMLITGLVGFVASKRKILKAF